MLHSIHKHTVQLYIYMYKDVKQFSLYVKYTSAFVCGIFHILWLDRNNSVKCK